MIRKLAVVSLLVFVVMTSVDVAPASASDKEEIVVWMWPAHYSDIYVTWYEKITAMFEEEYPGYTLSFELSGHSGGESLIAAVAGGVPPDVTLISISHMQSLYERGLLLDLNEFIEKTPHVALDNFIPASVEFGQKNGRVFGLPWSLEARAVLYNRMHMAEAGLDNRSESIRTWDDTLTYARAMTEKSPDGFITRSGFVMSGATSNFAAYLYSNGGSFYNESGTAVAFNDSKGLEILELIDRFSNEYDVMRDGATWRDLVDRNASMVVGDTSTVHTFMRADPASYTEWFDMAPIPIGPQGDRSSTVLWSNQFVIPTGVRNPENGWKFIEFWLRPDIQEEFFVHSGGNVLRTSARMDLFRSNAFFDSLREFPFLASNPDIFNSAQAYPYIRFSEINRVMGPLITAVQEGRESPSAALEEAERLANSILGQ